MQRFNYYKVAAITPDCQIGNVDYNITSMLEKANSLDDDTQLIVFSELAITGYTCQDLFYEELLLEKAKEGLVCFAKKSKDNTAYVVSLPIKIRNKLYNCAAFIFDHEILGLQAKTYLPNYNEFYEMRWFSSANELDKGQTIKINGKDIPISNSLLFKDTSTNACIGIEICEDAWASVPMSANLCLNGANIICNPSASNELIAKANYRRSLLSSISAQQYCGYIYASAGTNESTSDLLFSSHDMILEAGTILKESPLFETEHAIISEIDLDLLETDRAHFKTSMMPSSTPCTIIEYSSQKPDTIELTRKIDAYPFVLQEADLRDQRSQEIMNIQAHALATRLRKIHCQHAIIGISGGLDSTLALLVTHKAFEINGIDPINIHAITMPGFGTTKRTKTNADILMEALHVDRKEISIVKSVNQHFEDIEHDPSIHDITYENSQARMRTQILMNLANKYNGIVIGTGDLSELALGWCTYNGDHMSMYAVNASIPKTLVRYLVESVASQNEDLHDVLTDICNTPVSPELLPPDKDGKIQQKTEEVLGSYDLHDFFLYHMVRHHSRPLKIYQLALQAFDQVDKETIQKAIHTFYHRFFTQQFKRNCMPDGIKVGSICLSPRGDWRMPSDASNALWKQDLENI